MLETEKLPALLYDSDNLVKSVPVALRKITRDLVGMKANLERLSRRLKRSGFGRRLKLLIRPANNDIRRDLEIKAINSSKLK